MDMTIEDVHEILVVGAGAMGSRSGERRLAPSDDLAVDPEGVLRRLCRLVARVDGEPPVGVHPSTADVEERELHPREDLERRPDMLTVALLDLGA